MFERIACYLLYSQGNKLWKVTRDLTINHFKGLKRFMFVSGVGKVFHFVSSYNHECYKILRHLKPGEQPLAVYSQWNVNFESCIYPQKCFHIGGV